MTAEPPAQAPLSFTINAQYIKDLSFEGPAHPADVNGTHPPKIDVNVAANTRVLDDHLFEVVLNVRAQATMNDKHAFLIELAYAGLVTAPPGLNDEAIRYLMLVEAPHHLFPFARAIVANTTRDGGFPPLLLQPIDFNALFRQKQVAAQAPVAGHA